MTKNVETFFCEIFEKKLNYINFKVKSQLVSDNLLVFHQKYVLTYVCVCNRRHMTLKLPIYGYWINRK